jgi:hypothetical protein
MQEVGFQGHASNPTGSENFSPLDKSAAYAFMSSWAKSEPNYDLLRTDDHISVPGLRRLTKLVATELGDPAKGLQALERPQLILRLRVLLEDTHEIESTRHHVDQLTVSSNKPWLEPDNSHVYTASPKDHSLRGGSGCMSKARLRELRRREGWVAKTTLLQPLEVTMRTLDALIEQVRQEKLAELTRNSMTADEAKRWIEREYIDREPFMGPSHKRDPWDDTPKSVRVQLSPAAVDDLTLLHRNSAGFTLDRNKLPEGFDLRPRQMRERGMIPLEDLYQKWGFAHANQRVLAAAIIEDLRDSRIAELERTQGLTHDEAAKKASEYITIRKPNTLTHGHIFRYMNHEAAEDFEKVIKHHFPNKTQRQHNGHGGPRPTR